jgi:hypothetical protein
VKNRKRGILLLFSPPLRLTDTPRGDRLSES